MVCDSFVLRLEFRKLLMTYKILNTYWILAIRIKIINNSVKVFKKMLVNSKLKVFKELGLMKSFLQKVKHNHLDVMVKTQIN